jgi:NTP pyrophosphatase (non-canonical NTP hydrolase)
MDQEQMQKTYCECCGTPKDLGNYGEITTCFNCYASGRLADWIEKNHLDSKQNSGPSSDPDKCKCVSCETQTLRKVGDIPICIECYNTGRFKTKTWIDLQISAAIWRRESAGKTYKGLSELFNCQLTLVKNAATIQHRISQWSEETFPNQTTSAKIDHLADEVQEVRENPNDGEELADCAILLFNLAERAGVNLMMEVENKFAKNRKRTWGVPDERGVVKHIE